MLRNAKGFTLIEIAIVLVIIGLLLGGVLKGQELITGARVRNLISQQDGVKAAFYGFQDRYRALPGDYAAASTHLACGASVCPSGDGNGRIDTPSNGAPLHEDILVWNHLSKAGFINGSYLMVNSGTAAPSDETNPKNPYTIYLQLIYDASYGTGSPAAKHNLKTGNQVPVEIIAEVDRKIDDGRPYQGTFQFSTYAPAPSTAPTALGCVDNGNWKINGGATNCGATSLF